MGESLILIWSHNKAQVFCNSIITPDTAHTLMHSLALNNIHNVEKHGHDESRDDSSTYSTAWNREKFE